MKKLSYQIRTTEISDVSDRLLLIFEKEEAFKDEYFLNFVFDEMKSISEQMKEAIKRDAVQSKLKDADLRRDDAVRTLNNALVGYSALPIAELKNEGEKLQKVFAKYGLRIIKENYAVQSSLIESLLMDLSNSEMQSAIEKLSGMTEIVAELRQAQTSFTTLRAEYEKMQAMRKRKVSASSLKKNLLELINSKLITYLAAMGVANSSAYGNFVRVVSQVISDTNVTIKRRTQRKTDDTEQA